MKKTPTALGILERELVRQIIKLAAEGPLAQPVPPQPVKPTTADPVAKPIKPIAQMGKTTGGQSGRWAFDRQGPGDAQARAAIYDKTKQIGSQIYNASSQLGDRVGSMLPVGKPGNSGYGVPPDKPMSMADEMRGTFKQMGSDVKQMGTQLNNARLQAGNAIGNYGMQLNDARVQAGNAIGNYVGSMIPVGKPGNSGYGKPATYAYGPGGGGAGLPDAAGLVSKAVGAVDSRLPKPSASYAYGPGGGKAPSMSDVTDVAQGFVSGMGQGVQNMAGGVYNFGKGVATSAYHTPLAAAGILGQGAGRATDALGLTDNAGAAADKYTEHHLDSFWSGASDAANSFGQYVGVRGAPTAVADLNAQRNNATSPAAPQAPGPGQDPAAYGAAPPQGPMGTGIPGPGQDPAAYGAAPPQGPMGPATPAAPTIPPFTPSPEMQQFMTDNNIRTKDDLGNLTEEQQLQFDDLYEKQQQQPAAPPASKPSTYAYGMGPASASAQTAPKTQPAQAQPAAQTPEQPQKAWGGSLPEQATPDQRAQADQAQQQLADKSPEEKQKLSTAVNNPKSPEAQEVRADAANKYMAEAAADPNNPAPKDPQGYGEWAQGKLNEFGQLDPMAQLAIGAGLSIGVVSMLSSMMGGGGMGTMLLGALGLGAAGVVGASTGMLGNDAKGWVNDAFSGLVTAFGGNVPNEADIRARLEAAAKQGPEAAKAELEKVRGEVQPYAAFSQDANKFLTDSANPNFMYDQAHQYATNNYAKLFDEKMQNPTTWGERAGKTLGLTGEAANTPGTWSHYLSNWAESKEDRINRELAERGFVKQQSVNIMRKAARCWAGYEPVPGKKPYSNNSCRPKGKTKKKTEKKAGGPGTGSFTLGGHQAPAPVALNGTWTPEIAARVVPLLQRHDWYKKTDFSDPVKSRGAALSLLKTQGLNQDLRDNLHREIGSSGDHRGLNNFPGMPAAAPAAVPPPPRPVVSAPAAPAPVAAARPTPRPQAATPPAPVQPPPRRPDGRPSMIPLQKPQTTSTGPVQPPVSSIGANGQYQPSVFSSKGVGLPR